MKKRNFKRLATIDKTIKSINEIKSYTLYNKKPLTYALRGNMILFRDRLYTINDFRSLTTKMYCYYIDKYIYNGMDQLTFKGMRHYSTKILGTKWKKYKGDFLTLDNYNKQIKKDERERRNLIKQAFR